VLTVVATTDGGTVWTTQSLPTGVTALDGVSCATMSDCFAVGQDVVSTPSGVVDTGVVVSSTDGGSVWSAGTLPDGVRQLYGVSCPGPTTCWAVGATTTAVAILALAPPLPLPTVTGFTPGHRRVGSEVAISGTNLAGATEVSINGVAAVIVSDTADEIVVKVPRGATTGPVTVTTPAGTATSASSLKVRRRRR
jgi:hypothetical protein